MTSHNVYCQNVQVQNYQPYWEEDGDCDQKQVLRPAHTKKNNGTAVPRLSVSPPVCVSLSNVFVCRYLLYVLCCVVCVLVCCCRCCGGGVTQLTCSYGKWIKASPGTLATCLGNLQICHKSTQTCLRQHRVQHNTQTLPPTCGQAGNARVFVFFVLCVLYVHV